MIIVEIRKWQNKEAARESLLPLCVWKGERRRMKVTLELAVPQDAKEFIRIQNEAFYEDYKDFGVCPAYGRTEESLRDWILHKPNYKVMADGKLVGKISISKEDEEKGHVDCFCILPEYQNQGIGQLAVRLLEERHPEITDWTLETPLARPRNLHFYERCGYQMVGRMWEDIWLAVLKKKRSTKRLEVYKDVPVLESRRFLLRKTNMHDAQELWKVYSDQEAVPFFNSDNCGGDTFYYKTLERMEEAIAFWEASYQRNEFVRWTIIDKEEEMAVGTMECFRRISDDAFQNRGIFRLDLKSTYEKQEIIEELLQAFVNDLYELFDCKAVATKAIPEDTERVKALEAMAFYKWGEPLFGHDGTKYWEYYVLERRA